MFDVAVAIGLVVALLSGISAVIDRVLMTDVIENVGTIVFTSMVSTWLVTLGALVVFGGRVGLSGGALLAAIAAGVLKSVPLFIYFRAIRQQDSTVVATVVNADPLIVVIIGVLFLGETLSILQYAGIGILMTGVSILSVSEKTAENVRINRGVLLAAITMVLFAFQTVLYEVSLDAASSFWPVVFTVHTVAAAVGASTLISRTVREELGVLAGGTDLKATGTVLLSEFVSSISGILQFSALAVGLVSLVAPVVSTSHLFVFLIIGLLSLLGVQVDTKTSTRVRAVRLGAAIAVLVGILLLQA